MTFPGYGAQIYYNEAGEVLGWDYPSSEPYQPGPCEQAELDQASEYAWEVAEEIVDNIDGSFTDEERQRLIEAEWRRQYDTMTKGLVAS